jgi:hypothetical protein
VRPWSHDRVSDAPFRTEPVFPGRAGTGLDHREGIRIGAPSPSRAGAGLPRRPAARVRLPLGTCAGEGTAGGIQTRQGHGGAVDALSHEAGGEASPKTPRLAKGELQAAVLLRVCALGGGAEEAAEPPQETAQKTPRGLPPISEEGPEPMVGVLHHRCDPSGRQKPRPPAEDRSCADERPRDGTAFADRGAKKPNPAGHGCRGRAGGGSRSSLSSQSANRRPQGFQTPREAWTPHCGTAESSRRANGRKTRGRSRPRPAAPPG